MQASFCSLANSETRTTTERRWAVNVCRVVLFSGYAGALLVIACVLDRLARQSVEHGCPSRDFTATGPNEKR